MKRNRCNECGSFKKEESECGVCRRHRNDNKLYKNKLWLMKQIRAGHSYRDIADKADTSSSVIRKWRDKHELDSDRWDSHREQVLNQYGFENEI